MYKIQNIGAGRVPLQLPKGCITLESGAYLDVDEHAPRSWIRKNFDLQKLLAGKVFRLVHDSVNDRVPEQPTKPVIQNVVEEPPVRRPAPPPPKPQATVIDLSAEDDPTEEDAVPKNPHEVTLEDILGVDGSEEDVADPVEQAIMDEINDN